MGTNYCVGDWVGSQTGQCGDRTEMETRQGSEKLGKFPGKWNGEIETRKLNKAKEFA